MKKIFLFLVPAGLMLSNYSFAQDGNYSIESSHVIDLSKDKVDKVHPIISSIFSRVYSEQTPAYSPDGKPISAAEALEFGTFVTGNQRKTLDLSSINKIKVKELITYSKEGLIIKVEIVQLCPVWSVYDAAGVYIGEYMPYCVKN